MLATMTPMMDYSLYKLNKLIMRVIRGTNRIIHMSILTIQAGQII